MPAMSHIIASALSRSDNLGTLERSSERINRVLVRVNDKIRRLRAQRETLPMITDHAGEVLEPFIQHPAPPWDALRVADSPTPGMVSPEECRYYEYIGRFHSPQGAAVELGPWLGKSTRHILNGLRSNPHWRGPLHVYDDFVWRANWMDAKVAPEERLAQHADFLPLFQRYNADLSGARVEKRKITPYDGNDAVPPLEWDGTPISMLYVDCGRTCEANEAWWRLFQPSFIPGRTLLVLEDYRTHREARYAWYNQMRHWVDSKGPRLRLVHELVHGGIGTFLYLGEPEHA